MSYFNEIISPEDQYEVAKARATISVSRMWLCRFLWGWLENLEEVNNGENTTEGAEGRNPDR
jgi:hypothetical protein